MSWRHEQEGALIMIASIVPMNTIMNTTINTTMDTTMNTPGGQAHKPALARDASTS